MISAGIRYRITSGIRIRGDIGTGIEDRHIPGVDMLVIIRGQVVAVVGTIIRRGAMAIREAIGIRDEVMVIAITRRGAV
jgi:hypothetical protein